MLDAPVATPDVLESGVITDVAATTAAALEARPAEPRRAICLLLRFFFTYFALYVLTTQMLSALLPLPVGDIPNFGQLTPVRPAVEWVARTAFAVSSPLVVSGSGSGDKTYDWVHAFTVLVLSVAIVAIWSIVDRRRTSDVRLHQWFNLFTRFALGSTLVVYGVVKLIPMQMPAPSLNRLLEPFGNFSPMGVLWASIGASPAYEMFTGSAELLAAVLLFIPQTATLGALVALAVTGEVFTLNMTYDVPVKLFSFHLVVMSAALLAPELKRLTQVLVLNRIAGPSTLRPLGRSVRARRAIVIAQILFGAYIVGVGFYGASQQWWTFGGGAPKSALYGIWNVERMSIDGVERAPLLTDYDRWRRVAFDRPTAMSLHRMDDTVVTYGAAIDTAARTIALTKPGDPTWKTTWWFERPVPERLVLTGELDGRKIEMSLQLVDLGKFLLRQRGFNWIQEYPFNR